MVVERYDMCFKKMGKKRLVLHTYILNPWNVQYKGSASRFLVAYDLASPPCQLELAKLNGYTERRETKINAETESWSQIRRQQRSVASSNIFPLRFTPCGVRKPMTTETKDRREPVQHGFLPIIVGGKWSGWCYLSCAWWRVCVPPALTDRIALARAA